MRNIQELVNKSSSKNRRYMVALHDYLNKNNNELYFYLHAKNELEDFLISRTDKAHNEFVNASISGEIFPDDSAHNALYMGIENSISEYMEAILVELPEFEEKLEKSTKYKSVMENIVNSALPIFYKHLNTPYMDAQDILDKELIDLLKQKEETLILL